MRILTASAATLASSLVLTAMEAHADVSARDVWASWQALSGATGQTLTAEGETYSGGTLTLSGVTNSVAMPEGGSATGMLSEIVLTEQGDGTVSVTMPAEYPFSITATGSEGDDVAMDMVFRQTGLTLIASGAPDAIDYAMSAPRLEMSLGGLTAEGEPVDMRLLVGIDNLAGDYRTRSGDPERIESAFAAGAISIDMAVDDPAEGVAMSMTMTAESLAGNSSGTLSPFTASPDLAALLRQGLTSEASMTTGPGTFSLSVDDGEAPFTLSGASDSGTLDVALDQDGLRYGGSNRGVTGRLELLSMPLPPFDMAIAESGGEFRMPIVASDEAKDFGLKLTLSGLAIGESAWSMIDPMGGLPRDPANLALDLSGLGRWAVDISDPEALAELEGAGAMPGEVEALSINALALSLLGAELSGSGDFAFNNASMPPVPSGIVNLRLVGGNGLLDTLVAAGLLPEDQAMGARMMLGLFARPGDGADTLVSTIEVKDDGAVLANGQRIK